MGSPSYISVIGAGRWGQALAWLMAIQSGRVRLHARSDSVWCLSNDEKRFKNLPVVVKSDLRWALRSDIILVAINSSKLGELIAEIKGLKLDLHEKTFILCMKGMGPEGQFLHELWWRELPFSNVAIMGGPCQPDQLYNGKKAILGIATENETMAINLCGRFSGSLVTFEPFTAINGAAVCGASKNMLGFAGGMLDAFGLTKKKPLLEKLFMVEAGWMIKALGDDASVVDGLFYAEDNKVTLYYSGSRNVASGRKLVKDGALTSCEAVDSAGSLVQRMRLLGICEKGTPNMHGYLASIISCGYAPLKQGFLDHILKVASEYGVE